MGSVSDLYSNGTKSTTVDADGLLSLRAKTMALFDRAIWISYKSRSQSIFSYSLYTLSDILTRSRHPCKATTPDNAFWTSYMSLRKAVARTSDTLPPLSYQREICDDNMYEQRTPVNPTMLLVHTTLNAAIIVLHQIRAEEDEDEYERCLIAAQVMAKGAKEIGNLSSIYANTCLGVRSTSVASSVIWLDAQYPDARSGFLERSRIGLSVLKS